MMVVQRLIYTLIKIPLDISKISYKRINQHIIPGIGKEGPLFICVPGLFLKIITNEKNHGEKILPVFT